MGDLTGGQIAGIVCGVIVGVFIIGVLVWYFTKKRGSSLYSPESDSATYETKINGRNVSIEEYNQFTTERNDLYRNLQIKLDQIQTNMENVSSQKDAANINNDLLSINEALNDRNIPNRQKLIEQYNKMTRDFSQIGQQFNLWLE